MLFNAASIEDVRQMNSKNGNQGKKVMYPNFQAHFQQNKGL